MAAVVLNQSPSSHHQSEIEDLESTFSADFYPMKSPSTDTSYQSSPEDSDDECIYTLPPITGNGNVVRRVLVRLLLFVAIALISLGFSLLLAHKTLDIEIPRTLAELKESALHLETVAQETWTGYLHVTFVFAVLYLWQQAFSIPGSILLNLLGGYLYGTAVGSLWTSVLTAGGATLAYLLAYLISEPFMELPWVVTKIDVIRTQVDVNKKNGGLFWWLLFARLFPFTPYWSVEIAFLFSAMSFKLTNAIIRFMNMSAPMLEIPIFPFFISTFFGSLPYNFICCQAGEVIGQISSTADIFTISMVVKMVIISVISLVPVVFGSRIKKYMGDRFTQKDDTIDLRQYDQIHLAV